MEKKYLETLQEMANDKNVKGRKLIERLIWLNTVEPKYKEEMIVLFTDRSSQIWGNRLINFKGIVKKVQAVSFEHVINYLLEVPCRFPDGSTYTTTIWVTEKEITEHVKICDDFYNDIRKYSEYQQSVDM